MLGIRIMEGAVLGVLPPATAAASAIQSTRPDRQRAPTAVLDEALRRHERNTGLAVTTAVADRQYGTARNDRMLHERGALPCIPHKRVREDPSKFERRLFVYDPAHDRYPPRRARRASA